VESERLIEQQGEGYSLDIVDTLRSLRKEIRSCKADNDRLIEARQILARPPKSKQKLMQ